MDLDHFKDRFTWSLLLALSAFLFTVLALDYYLEVKSQASLFPWNSKPCIEAPRPESTSLKDTRSSWVIEITLQPGDTLSKLMENRISPNELSKLIKACKKVYPLRDIKAGNRLRLFFKDKSFFRLEYQINPKEKLYVNKEKDGFSASRRACSYKNRTCILEGRITSSLFVAVEEIGERPQLATRLAEIFAWDVDFRHSLRRGDTFKVVVEKLSRKGRFIEYGRILAAQLTNRGHTHRAFLYKNESGSTAYYDGQGKSVQKRFLKSPLRFTRISSGYSESRLHPILNIRRPHHGIDYAAPAGTPVRSVADGLVEFTGYSKPAGKYVKIRHNSIYETVYNHLCRFTKGIRKGRRVKQGQCIGYVGRTGYATGPHLDFRMKKNGRTINPLNVKSPPVKNLSSRDMKRFTSHIRLLLAALREENPPPSLPHATALLDRASNH